MSRFYTIEKDGVSLEEIESMEICKWRVNEVCCNGDCGYVADFPYPHCKCKSKKDCDYFEKEDGII